MDRILYPEGEGEPWRWSQGLLLCFTAFTTLLAGASLSPRLSDLGVGEFFRELAREPALLVLGLPFSLSLLFILGVHEMGHFLTARRYGVRATWPYFLPGPPFLSLGTFGAFIRLKGPLPHRRALMETGANGPLWGFLAALAVALLGLLAGPLGYRSPQDLGFNVGLPAALWLLRGVVAGHWEWTLTFFENPLLLSAWLGFFVQGLNLLPMGQLDGGHVVYAFFGRRHRLVSAGAAVLFALLGIASPQWLLWVGLLIFVLGLRHPPTLDDGQPLGGGAALRGLLSLVVFLLCFVPVPFP
ncbi:MAG: site-2 protease family protein [Acidobacteriota bacterium]